MWQWHVRKKTVLSLNCWRCSEAVAEQSAVETEQGKQVLVAKCAFSEQRNDSYVLASVVVGTASGADRNGPMLLLLLQPL